MRPIDFVITGMPRSGTSYTAALFTKLGIRCGHQRYFRLERHRFEMDRITPFGEVSWMAVPFLHLLHSSTHTAYQTRNHVDVLNSMASWSVNGSMLRDSGMHVGYVKLIIKACSYDIRNEPDERVRLIEFYKEWIDRLKDKTDIVYNVTELKDPLFTQALVKSFCNVAVSVDQVQEALTTIPTDLGTHGNRKQWASEFLVNNPKYKEYFE